jgi:hypothetical protein
VIELGEDRPDGDRLEYARRTLRLHGGILAALREEGRTIWERRPRFYQPLEIYFEVSDSFHCLAPLLREQRGKLFSKFIVPDEKVARVRFPLIDRPKYYTRTIARSLRGLKGRESVQSHEPRYEG